MDEFQGQYLVNLRGVVPVAFEMALDHPFERRWLDVWPGKASPIEQHLPNVVRQNVPVPDTEMVEFVPTEEQAFQGQRRKMIEPGHPLGHTVVGRVFRLERELENG